MLVMGRRQQAETLDTQASGALSARIARTRQMRGLSQQSLAERAGVSIGTVRAIETGKTRDPGVFTVRTIAFALGLTLDQIVTSLEAGPTREE